MCHVQLKRTDFRSLAPGVGVNGPASNAPRPPPRPGPGGPPPARPCGGPLWALCAPGALCAPAGAEAVTKAARNTPAVTAVRNAIPSLPPRGLVDRDLELFVALLDRADESGRVAVLGGKDLDLQRL